MLKAEELRMEVPNPYQPLVEKAFEREVAAIETHYATLLAPMDPKEARQIAVELERLAGMLQAATGSMKLTPTRPDTFTFCIFKGNEQAQQLFGVRAAPPEEDYYGNQPGYMDMAGKPDYCGFPLLAFVIHRFAQVELQFASSGRAPQWLLYGFGSASEKAIMGRNHIGISIIHNINGRTIEDRWDEQVALLKKAGTLREWPDFFDIPPQEYNSAVFQQAYSIVSFLFEPQRKDKERPKRFLKMVDLIADGFTATKAIEQAYEKEIAVLQAEWLEWIDTRG